MTKIDQVYQVDGELCELSRYTSLPFHGPKIELKEKTIIKVKKE